MWKKQTIVLETEGTLSNNLQEFDQNTHFVPFYNVSIRGEKDDVYYCLETRRCIAALINSETGRR